MANYRRDRVNDAVAQECALILREVKDPRVTEAMLSVTRASVTGDLRNASVYVSALTDTDERELKKGLKSISPFVRSELAKRLNLRVTPEIIFILDNSIRHGAEIAALMKTVEAEEKAREKVKEESDE